MRAGHINPKPKMKSIFSPAQWIAVTHSGLHANTLGDHTRARGLPPSAIRCANALCTVASTHRFPAHRSRRSPWPLNRARSPPASCLASSVFVPHLSSASRRHVLCWLPVGRTVLTVCVLGVMWTGLPRVDHQLFTIGSCVHRIACACRRPPNERSGYGTRACMHLIEPDSPTRASAISHASCHACLDVCVRSRPRR